MTEYESITSTLKSFFWGDGGLKRRREDDLAPNPLMVVPAPTPVTSNAPAPAPVNDPLAGVSAPNPLAQFYQYQQPANKKVKLAVPLQPNCVSPTTSGGTAWAAVAPAAPMPAVAAIAPGPVISAPAPMPVAPVISAMPVTGVNISHQQAKLAIGVAPLAAPSQPAWAPPAVWSGCRPSAVQVQGDRRERNKEHAKNSRIRKKQQEDALQHDLEQLQKENASLKKLIKTELPDAAADIIGQDCYNVAPNHSFPGNDAIATTSPTTMGRNDFELIESLTREHHSFVLTDPRLPDNPIVYASPTFCQLTGYQRDQVIGRNCRFLQGPQTSPQATQAIRQAIKTGSDCTVRMINVKQDGTPFWNQFFLAALHDKHSRIVNFVGVQSEVESPSEEELEKMQQCINMKAAMQVLPPVSVPAPVPTPTPAPSTFKATPPPPLEESLQSLQSDNTDDLDWAVLAETLEEDLLQGDVDLDFDADLQFDFNDDPIPASFPPADNQADGGLDEVKLQAQANPQMVQSAPAPATAPTELKPLVLHNPDPSIPAPRVVIAQTIKSELIHALLESQGNVTTERFNGALTLLSSLYQSSDTNTSNASLSPLLHGAWRSLSRPSYSDCLGQNDKDDFVYTLGKMSFNMFKPGNLRCTVQRTITAIESVCEMDKAPRAAPFSLRRELAMHENPESATPNTMLKSYDINVALTIEPSDFEAKPGETVPAPPCRLRALKVIHGYFLPDPETPNRLTVWFTGGKLSPVLPESSSEFGGLEDWKRLFGAEHKRTWGESLSVMGAKVFLGAELPKGMDPDGAMSYTLHRPFGGHGKGYVDILYLDDDLFITKGNYGTIHVIAKNV